MENFSIVKSKSRENTYLLLVLLQKKRKNEKNKSGKRKEGRFILKKKRFYEIHKLTVGILWRTSTEIKKVESILSYKLLFVYSDHLLGLNYQLLD